MVEFRIVLVEPEYEINIGYVARVMKNFEFYELYIVNPKVQIGEIARKFASHAVDVLESAVIVNKLDEAIDDVDVVIGTTGKPGHDYLVHRIAVPPWELKYCLKMEGRVAILFGRESIGLTNEELEKCDIIVTIPANPEYPIMNVSHAAAVVLYEIYKHRYLLEKRTREQKLATRKEREILLNYMRELMRLVELPDYRVHIAEIILKRTLGRAFITKREYYTLCGIFRRAVQRLQSSRSTDKRLNDGSNLE
ncbi:MAG: hypothetical protein DRJ40_09185 [Thermoprotei archaeon]|nr:MAG: hypothetical protein DRJ40_09185 [Thermoprotei archaeon]